LKRSFQEVETIVQLYFGSNDTPILLREVEARHDELILNICKRMDDGRTLTQGGLILPRPQSELTLVGTGYMRRRPNSDGGGELYSGYVPEYRLGINLPHLVSFREQQKISTLYVIRPPQPFNIHLTKITEGRQKVGYRKS
jgi:hypothetical protein